ncbi:hypothetical protein [Bacillus sp. EB01]|uniref:hypothetical protein n=1 Tax=Bacillus sp. EB01 TaxID=1347086 RepID=UPI0005C6DC36|nr:hypothetical protein [Bacillus sp. EB01]
MQQVKLFLTGFIREPLWFKLLIITSFLATIILGSTVFSSQPYMESGSKLAAAILFFSYGVKIRRSHGKALILFACAFLSLFLSILSIVR